MACPKECRKVSKRRTHNYDHNDPYYNIPPCVFCLGKIKLHLVDKAIGADKTCTAKQFLSMGYIELGDTHNRVSLHFAKEMWVFGIMTLLLLMATLGSWLWLEMRARRCPGGEVDCEAGTPV